MRNTAQDPPATCLGHRPPRPVAAKPPQVRSTSVMLIFFVCVRRVYVCVGTFMYFAFINTKTILESYRLVSHTKTVLNKPH